MKCPYCSSIDTTWKSKATKWECNSCEERFAGGPPADQPESGRSQLLAKATKPKRIFFSYGHDANRELVDRFKADLEARGHQVWIDYKEIGSWDDWKGTITRGIHDAEMAIAFLSIHSTRDPGVCRNEVAMALQHFGKVYPVLVEQVPLESIPVTVAHLQWPDLSRWREFRDQEDLDFERFYEEKFLEIVSRVEGEAGRFASEAEVLRRVLNPSGFEGRFARHLAGFTGREWVFEAYEHWLDHQPSSRVFWVKAGPGFGKTALAVQMANRHRAAIVGTWFCDHQSVELRDPLRALQTIAYQLALRWDDYRVRLLPRLGLFADSAPERIEEARKELAKKSLHDLFSFLISEPMAGLIWREHKLVILVDALDEGAEADGTNPLAALISGRFLELPEWIGFVVTSRPDASVVPYLQGFKPFAIEAGDARNTADLQAYCEAQVGPMLPTENRERLCALLVDKSEGMMLYLRLVAEGLREGTLEADGLETLESGLPGLHSRYHAAFEARFRKDFQETVQPLLRLVMAAPGPIPMDLVAEVLGWDRETAVRARTLVGSYLFEDGGGLSLFHKTVGEWLASESTATFYTNPEPAGKMLGEFLWVCFVERVENEHGLTDKIRWEAFVGDWVPMLLDLTDRNEDWDGIYNLALWFTEKINWNAAEALYRRILDGFGKVNGPEHPDTLLIVNNLGLLMRDKGNYDESELLCRRASEGREKSLGLEHPDTLGSINNLGYVLMDKGHYDEAERLFYCALDGYIKSLGTEHPDTLEVYNNLGVLLKHKGDYDGAEVFCRRALDGKEKSLGLEHPDTLGSITNLGNLLSAKGDYDEAEDLLRYALGGYTKAFGPQHPHTLLVVSNLGLVMQEKGNYEEAELFCYRALEGRKKSLGLEHPDTLGSIHNLGNLLFAKGDYDGAEELFRHALIGYENILGFEHEQTLSSVNNIAITLRKKGDYDGAEALQRRAMEGYESILGLEHPDTLMSYANLGSIYFFKGDHDIAKEFCLKAFEGSIASLGENHPATLGYMNNLGFFMFKAGDYEKAEHLLIKALKLYEDIFGNDHPATLNCIDSLGDLFVATGSYQNAELLLCRAVEGRERLLGAEHSDTLKSVISLGKLLSCIGRYGEASELLRKFSPAGENPENTLLYNLACYECLDGNLDEAKCLIAGHLAINPEMKATAMADSDFSAIHDFIEAL